jgi:O-antigen/teichoic acid export membrane protein
MRLCHFIRKPIEQLGEICLPTAGALHAQSQDESLQRLLEKGMGFAFLLAAGMFIGIIYFGDLVIENWMGAKYLESQRLLLILFGMQIVALPVGVMRSILFGMGHVRAPALVYLVEAIVNLALSLVLCKSLGTFGVALGTAIPILLFELGILLPYGLHHLRIPPWRMVCHVLLPQLLPLAGLLVYAMSVNALVGARGGWWSLVQIALGGGLVLGVGWLVFRFLQRRFTWNRGMAVG